MKAAREKELEKDYVKKKYKLGESSENREKMNTIYILFRENVPNRCDYF